MKNIRIKNNQNIIISDENHYSDDKVQEFIDINISNNSWGKQERWVRAKYNVIIDSIDQESVEETIYPDEQYSDEDVLSTEERLKYPNSDSEEAEVWVKLRADYTIEINDYKRIPKEVTMRQARIALVRAGLYETIQNYNDEELKIEWEFSQVVKRNWPSLDALTTSLGITSIQVDDLFIVAENL